MFGLGVWEIAIILGFALVVLGPQKLPAVAKTLGRSLRELRRAASDFQVTLEQEADAEERRQRIASLPAVAPAPTPAAPLETEHEVPVHAPEGTVEASGSSDDTTTSSTEEPSADDTRS